MNPVGRTQVHPPRVGTWSSGTAPLPRDPGTLAAPPAPEVEDHLAVGEPAVPEPRLPLSLADRISLSSEKKQLAQAFYGVGRELARRVTGDPDRFKFQGVGLTNVDEVASLWSLQAKHGDAATTVRSVPVTLAALTFGALNNVPIEGAKVEDGKLVEARASGHSLNPLLNAASAVAAGVALSMVPGLAPLALAGPLLTAAPLISQRFGDTNAPVHEMAHACQFLLVGDLMNRGMIDESDLVAIQNDAGPTGYLWGGETEKAAHAAETTGDVKPLFEVLKKRVAERLEERHGLASAPIVAEAEKLLDGHEAWMARDLAARRQA